MVQEKRFGRRVAMPSTVEIVHELKLMALRQSLDAALEREAAPGATVPVLDPAAPASAQASLRSEAL